MKYAPVVWIQVSRGFRWMDETCRVCFVQHQAGLWGGHVGKTAFTLSIEGVKWERRDPCRGLHATPGRFLAKQECAIGQLATQGPYKDGTRGSQINKVNRGVGEGERAGGRLLISDLMGLENVGNKEHLVSLWIL